MKFFTKKLKGSKKIFKKKNIKTIKGKKYYLCKCYVISLQCSNQYSNNSTKYTIKYNQYKNQNISYKKYMIGIF